MTSLLGFLKKSLGTFYIYKTAYGAVLSAKNVQLWLTVFYIPVGSLLA